MDISTKIELRQKIKCAENLVLYSSTMNQIKQNLKKINDRKVTLNQKGSGIFSFLLPMLASTIIPSLIQGKGVSKNRNILLK